MPAGALIAVLGINYTPLWNFDYSQIRAPSPPSILIERKVNTSAKKIYWQGHKDDKWKPGLGNISHCNIFVD